jgi:hypothetical protein
MTGAYNEMRKRLHGERGCGKCGEDLPWGMRYWRVGDRYYCSETCMQ